MTSDTSNGRGSDTETAEKPVREQLKKATIAAQPTDTTTETAHAEMSTDQDTAPTATSEVAEGRRSLQRKRSFEELEGEQSEQSARGPSRNHTRKRSRDSMAEEDELNNGQRKISGESARASIDEPRRNGSTANGAHALADQRATTPDLQPDSKAVAAAIAVASPKTKRSRLHSAGIEENGSFAAEKPAETSALTDKIIDEEPADSSAAAPSDETAATKIPASSGFANSSAISPFGALAGKKSPPSEPAQTSSSAFESSGFGALSKASSSGFGSIGATSGGFGSGGSFATGGKSPLASLGEGGKSPEPSGSAFGGALGQKSAFATAGTGSGGFGSTSSGFGSLSAASGFASPLGGGFGSLASGGLSTFASGKPSSSLAAAPKTAKAFGAPADDDEEGAEDDDERKDDANVLSQDDEKQDERFYRQDLETGEEEESTEYSCRAKLYDFAANPEGKKEWRERGLGVLRLNIKHGQGEDGGKPRARFLMRADGSHRVLLNSPIKKEIKFGAPNGGPPQGSFIYFMGTVSGGSGGLELLQLKMKAQFATELHQKIVDLQEEM